jgi:hypothetical protein
MRRTLLASAFVRRLLIMTLAGALAAMLAVIALAGTPAVATHTSTHMRTPFDVGETWKVINGYGQGRCHHNPSACGTPHDEYYALDLVPVNAAGGTMDAGGKDIYSPVQGTVSYAASAGAIGWLVKIKTKDGGHLVHLYHLMNVSVSPGDQVTADDPVVGQVYNKYPGAPNHLHIHLSNLQGVTQPIKLGGREYSSGNTWNGQLMRENVVFGNPNYGNPHWWFVEDVSDMRNTTLGNDVVSSLQVNPGCDVTLYEHINYAGRSITFKDNVTNLATHGFDDITSSVKLDCRPAGAL